MPTSPDPTPSPSPADVPSPQSSYADTASPSSAAQLPAQTVAESEPAPEHVLAPHPGRTASRAEVLDWIREKVRWVTKSPGVYLMKDADDIVLYVGKARSLRDRVGSYFQPSARLASSRGPHIAAMIADRVHDVDVLACESEVEALLTENRLIKDIQPAFNERLRDDKTFPYLMITTGDDFPGIYVTREPRDKGVKLFGPFTAAAQLREAVNALQKVYKFRTCELDIHEGDDKRRFFRPCLLHAINQCTAPCAALIDQETYRQDVQDLISFLNSKRSVVIRDLTKLMQQAAAERRFEDAAKFRDRIKAIQALSLSGDPDENEQPEVFYQDPGKGLAKLAEILKLDNIPRVIEGIDIAHLHGEDTVGSLVCFIDGRPHKPGYKRFRIKTVAGVDDFASIREVVGRRYRHAAIEQEIYPDLIMIDGGLGQLHAAMDAFGMMRRVLAEEGVEMIRPPTVVSLAKQQEEIYTLTADEPIRLARNNAGLRLLQQVRDEAHRFGQAYHHLLRAKRTFDEDISAGKRPPPRKRASKKKKPPSDPAGIDPPAPEEWPMIEPE